MKKTETTGYVKTETRFCLECGDEICYGRSDRKFCSDKCRYDYHNVSARPSKINRGRTLAILDRNYAILEGLIKKHVSEIPLIQICEMGFNPAHMTSAVLNRSHLECGLYDIHYRQSGCKISGITKLSVYLPCKKITKSK